MPSGRPRRRFSVAVALTALTLVAVTACSGDDTKNTAKSGGLEKTKVVVRVLANADAAQLYIAKQKGYFAAEGLEVEPKVEQKGDVAIAGAQSGAFDLIGVNYVSLFAAQAKGQKFRIVSDAYSAKPNTFLIMTLPGSPIKTVKDLEGKRVSVSTPNNIAQLLDNSVMETNGVDYTKVDYKTVAFPQMVTKLKQGELDAVSLIEPLITAGIAKDGLRTVVDTAAGPTADLAISGYASSEKWAKDHPNTLAAFQRAMAKGQADAAASRQTLQTILPTYTEIDAKTAAVLNLGGYPTSLSKTRLQRVVDLMVKFKFVDGTKVNLSQMLGESS